MEGVLVGKRRIGTQAPVTVGWENVPRVEGGPFKRLFFTWFQPTVLFAMILFWYYAPNSIAKASTAIGIGIGFRVLLMAMEFFFPRHESWQLTWKEVTTDLFYVGLGYTVLRLVDGFIGSDVMVGAIQDALHWDKFNWFITLPILVQAFLISFIFDFGQYWMHRGMHNWYPLWLPHSVHHYITQLNINKGAVGNPVELFLIGLGVGGFFDFVPRAFLLAGAIGMAVGSYQHINVRFNSPRWWRFLFHTTEHHSLHHSQDFEASRSNFTNTYIFIDRMFGTCVDGEAELLGMEGGRRMSIREQMTYPFTDGWRTIKAKFARPATTTAVPAE
ncbi:sterol desaturase/sphingolipid hydroxylase (fatty acid hydroxylase superfamily) [Novosphingobium capsulatum]|uniref:Sterol desaturase/sphingolipid hydroxylase (Fatty acid hydroxylase superfamily) n=1 Tax=Novosphingobium capsulatum TaxID=13688 RepID=A0ABU1MII1_9SPHN|nr:sterol desaturase family protein [Novosphingobium capsulatum]MDR6510116.1 sterol desaturase/sphingolipid hydroxylase (fatty acid hydroxylase superfamily) [Novosphingobium capsulatum]WQD94542.1 sterol desaturase family protein [Novosphingobium capsulatum]